MTDDRLARAREMLAAEYAGDDVDVIVTRKALLGPVRLHSFDANVQRAVTAIAKSLTPREPSEGDGWEPIETAPRDQILLLYVPREQNARRRIMVGSYDEQRRNWIVIPGLYRIVPTYWHALPAAPAATPARGSAE